MKTIERTGSRSTTWKLLLGVLPVQRNKELWIGQLHQSRQRFIALQQKYFGIRKLIVENSNPLSAMMTRSTQDLVGGTKLSIAEASKQDVEITSLIKKDIDRTLPELELFQSSLFSLNL